MYIKTTEGVYELTNGREIVERWDIADNPHLIEYEYNHSTEENDEYDLGVFIAQSDNLEDLCDEFVMTHYFPETDYTHRKILNEDMDSTINMIKAVRLKKINNKSKDFNIYGCIWIEIKLPNNKTVFRLEPVVIMNDEGNFELI